MKKPYTQLVVLLLLSPWVAPSPASAQADRYELGRRLRLFERHWDEVFDPAARERAARQSSKAVQSFFALQLGQAGKAITEAHAALDSADPVDPARRWARSLAVDLDHRLLDAGQARLTAKLRAFYKDGEPVPGALVKFTLLGEGDGQPLGPEVVEAVGTLPQTLELDFGRLPEGDHILRTQILSEGGGSLASIDQTLSALERRDERIGAASEALETMPERPDDARARVDRESAITLRNLLTALANGQTMESDVMARAEAFELEGIVAALKEGTPYHGPGRPGSHRVTFANGNRVVPSRVLVPEGLDASRPVPLVVALHGAGGTENLFFEGYGHGSIVDLCRERGWLLVSPRVGGFSGLPVQELVESVALVYPVDRSRVFAVGHSMGAGLAMNDLSKAPDRFAGVAALGGGGVVRPSEALKKVPVYVGVGTDDFALRSSRALKKMLEDAGVERVEYREFPGIEHLLIVQVALPEVFNFFDSIARTTGTEE